MRPERHLTRRPICSRPITARPPRDRLRFASAAHLISIVRHSPNRLASRKRSRNQSIQNMKSPSVLEMLLTKRAVLAYRRYRLQFVYVVSLLTYMIVLPGCATVPEIDKSLQHNAIMGDREAQYEMGMHYYRARYAFFGKASYWEDAARWFEMAASQGDQRANYRLATYYFNVRSDYGESFNRLQLPAQDGIAEAQLFLGVHYAQAWGTSQDLVLAYKWMALGFEGGVPDPIGKLADLDWLVDRGKLNSEQIDEGQRLAANHTATYGKSRSIEAME